jgi:LacI family transcriptional regulator
MNTTISDVARAAGVGRTTALRALTGKGYISEEKRTRILKAAKELNYTPNSIARSLSTGKTALIGIMVTPNSCGELGPVMTRVETAVGPLGYKLIYLTTNGSPEEDMLVANQLKQMRVEAVLAFPHHEISIREPYQELLRAGIKLVMLDKVFPGLDTPQFYIDYYYSAHMASHYLMSLGHRKIGLFVEGNSFYPGPERAKGLMDAYNEIGIEPHPEMVMETPNDYESGASNMKKLLQLDDPPTALISRDDKDAAGAVQAALDLGLSMPEDLSVICNKDYWHLQAFKTPLTAISFPITEMIDMGVNSLIAMMSGETVQPYPVPVKTELIIRESTGLAPGLPKLTTHADKSLPSSS